jgi:hypothetical protein
MQKRTYSREQLQTILGRAIERQHKEGDTVSHEELIAIAGELGVSKEAIEAAAATVDEDIDVAREVDRRVRRARRGFQWHLLTYALVNVMLAFINYMTPGPIWFYFAAVPWMVGLGLHAMAALSVDREALTEKVRRRKERDRERAKKRERGDQLKRSAKRFSTAAIDHLAGALDAAATSLEKQNQADARKARVKTNVRVVDGDVVVDEERSEPDEQEDERDERRARRV